MRSRLESIKRILQNDSYSNAARVDMITKEIDAALTEVPAADKGDPGTVLDDKDIQLKDSVDHDRFQESRAAADALAANPPDSPHNLVARANDPETPKADHVKDPTLQDRAGKDVEEEEKKRLAAKINQELASKSPSYPGTVEVADDGLSNARKEAAHHKTADNGEKLDNPPPASDTLKDGKKTGNSVQGKDTAAAGPAAKQQLGKDAASGHKGHT